MSTPRVAQHMPHSISIFCRSSVSDTMSRFGDEIESLRERLHSQLARLEASSLSGAASAETIRCAAP